jgi:hypothetical protein
MRAAAQGQHVAHRQPSSATAHDKGLYALNRHAMPSVGGRDQAWPSIQVIQGFSANSQAKCPSEFAEATIGVGFRKSQKFSADGEKLWHEAESVVGHCGHRRHFQTPVRRGVGGQI